MQSGLTVALESGGDTTMQGAVVSGERVKADIGCDLTIESIQDESHYQIKNQSMGGSVTVGYGFAASGASVSKRKVNSDLKGGVIASMDQTVNENKNTFTTPPA